MPGRIAERVGGLAREEVTTKSLHSRGRRNRGMRGRDLGGRAPSRLELCGRVEVPVVVRDVEPVGLCARKDQRVRQRHRPTRGPRAIGESNGTFPHARRDLAVGQPRFVAAKRPALDVMGHARARVAQPGTTQPRRSPAARSRERAWVGRHSCESGGPRARCQRERPWRVRSRSASTASISSKESIRARTICPSVTVVRRRGPHRSFRSRATSGPTKDRVPRSDVAGSMGLGPARGAASAAAPGRGGDADN